MTETNVPLGASVADYIREYNRLCGDIMGAKMRIAALERQAEADGLKRQELKAAAKMWRKDDDFWPVFAEYVAEAKREMEDINR
jgi:hypothetical protein